MNKERILAGAHELSSRESKESAVPNRSKFEVASIISEASKAEELGISPYTNAGNGFGIVTIEGVLSTYIKKKRPGSKKRGKEKVYILKEQINMLNYVVEHYEKKGNITSEQKDGWKDIAKGMLEEDDFGNGYS